jgi:phosphoglucomutase
MAEPVVTVVQTKSFEGQKPGTSGLRKKTTVFQQPNYLANFIQSTLNALPSNQLKGSTLVVGGDGRFYCKDAAQLIIKIAAANGVGRIWVGRDALISTPAVSCIIRQRENGVAFGGFILSASHNPGGPHEDFGIKYNCENGGPAPEGVTDQIYKNTTQITEYKIANSIPDIDLSQVCVHSFGSFKIEVIDSTADYVAHLKKVFDFTKLKTLVSRSDFRLTFDAMNGVAGPYVQQIFLELGAAPASLLNCIPKDDFGGEHPDPNLTYAKQLVKLMGLTREGTLLPGVDKSTIPDFGAAADGDADRNMILGKQFFVTPSDSVAIIAANATCIPYFSSGLKAVARSMPTSGATDRVAEKLGIRLFEVPTGWKFFGNIMDSKAIYGKEDFTPLICGEESFGTGSDHVREKDGVWAVLCWLSILAANNEPDKPFVSVEDIVRAHWSKYGRNYYCRYDYENIETEKADKLTDHLTQMCGDGKPDIKLNGVPLQKVDEFEYLDPVDGSISKRQGWRFLFQDGSRFVFRLSGTGSSGATIRLYLEKYETDPSRLSMERDEALGDLVQLALDTSMLAKFCERDAPTVIT